MQSSTCRFTFALLLGMSLPALANVQTPMTGVMGDAANVQGLLLAQANLNQAAEFGVFSDGNNSTVPADATAFFACSGEQSDANCTPPVALNNNSLLTRDNMPPHVPELPTEVLLGVGLLLASLTRRSRGLSSDTRISSGR